MIAEPNVPEWQQKPCLLTTDNMLNPRDVMLLFFESYSLPVCRSLLWTLLTGFMNSEFSDSMDRTERSDMLCFYRDLSELIEASNLLSTRPSG